jgi:hypothetical protein
VKDAPQDIFGHHEIKWGLQNHATIIPDAEELY